MATRVEPLSWQARLLQDVGRLAGLALVLIPLYVLCNDYWRSIERLLVLYVLFIVFCSRLGGGLQRRVRRLPAEIPPWYGNLPTAPAVLAQTLPFATAEAVRNIRKDPRYVQDVLKPRLLDILVCREGIQKPCSDEALALVAPEVRVFLQRQEPVGLWATYGRRRQRLQEVLEVLRRIEGMPG